MRRIARTGGPVSDICDASFVAPGTWSADDVILFSSGRGLMRARASGGAPTEIKINIPPDAAEVISPQFLPDNRHFLFQTRDAAGSGVWRVGSLESDRTTQVFESPWPARFAKPNYLLSVRGASLVAQSMDLETFALTGAEKVLVSNILGGHLQGSASFSASETVLAFGASVAGEPGQLTWFDVPGVRRESIPSPAEGEYLNPSISPDGTHVALNGREPQTGNWDIWIWDRARGFASRLTSDPGIDSDAIWSPNSKQVIFRSNRGGRTGLYRRSVDGSGTDELVATVEGDAVLGDWSSDGRYILYSHRFGASPYSAWAMPLAGDRTPRQLIDHTFQAYSPRLSPDGRWLAYADLSTGSLEVHVRRFMADGERTQISQGGGIHPRWIKNGRGLAFAKIGGGVGAVDLEFGASGIRVGPEQILMPLAVATLNDSRAHYDVTRDGRQLLVRQPSGPPRAPCTVVVNWTARLK